MRFLTDGKRHLVCYPYSRENLHRMAEHFGLGRHWFHKNHYDIPHSRILDIPEQCEIVSPKTIVRVIRGESLD